MRRAALLLALAAAVAIATPSSARRTDPATGAAPALTGLAVGNGGLPFAGDHRGLTTITPNGDGLRDEAVIRFSLTTPAAVTLTISRSKPNASVVSRTTARLPAGPNRLFWRPPPGTAARTYFATFSVVGRSGRREYAAVRRAPGDPPRTAVIRVRGVDAGVGKASYRPGELVGISVATDASTLQLQVFQAGPEHRATFASNELNGVAVTEPVALDWRARRHRPDKAWLRVGADWKSGLYYAQLTADDGRVGYAPFVVRPLRLGVNRVAVVLPTYTWQAYNFWDDNGDGFGDTWYQGWSHRTVRLGRPFLQRGVPPHFRKYDLPFLHWLHWNRKEVDFLAESDVTGLANGDVLARSYDLIVFPGHHEYVPTRMYDNVRRYRDLGGNLMFLSANNFFWKIVKRGSLLERTVLWRNLGRPEAALIGVQYRSNDQGHRRAPYVARSSRAASWLFAETGVRPGDGFGSFGIEIDATARSSPPGTEVVAEIPHLFGRGHTAQMTYYERRGAKVFAAGALDFASWSNRPPVKQMLENLWQRLAQP